MLVTMQDLDHYLRKDDDGDYAGPGRGGAAPVLQADLREAAQQGGQGLSLAEAPRPPVQRAH